MFKNDDTISKIADKIIKSQSEDEVKKLNGDIKKDLSKLYSKMGLEGRFDSDGFDIISFLFNNC